MAGANFDVAMVCVSLTSPTTEQMLSDLHRASAQADLAELRLDFMREHDIAALLTDRPCPVIVTNRPAREGGRYEGRDGDRVKPLRRAVALGAEYIDIEHDSVRLIRDKGESKIIISYHNFSETPRDLWHIYEWLRDQGADIVKVATMANDVTDCLLAFDVLRRAEMPTIALCMGPAGILTRILAHRFGAYLTFATLGEGVVSGPGQLTVAEMREVYGADRIGAETRLFGVVGPEANTSPAVGWLNEGLRAAGADAVCVPVQTTDDAWHAQARLPQLGLEDCVADGITREQAAEQAQRWLGSPGSESMSS
ncbi:MAG: type I 3-dehydroquinate dehydratase [Armatimonadota bacterium]